MNVIRGSNTVDSFQRGVSSLKRPVWLLLTVIIQAVNKNVLCFGPMNKKIERKKYRNKIIQSILSLSFLVLGSCLYVNNSHFLKITDKSISCRIGITTNLGRRKKEWIRRYKKEGKIIKSWKVLSVHESKSSAQAVETREAKLQNCEAHPGGRDSEKEIWYVYKIEYH